MKRYNVQIVAVDECGNEVRFTEVVEYPNIVLLTQEEYRKGTAGISWMDDFKPATASCVSESEREGKAIEQVRRRRPDLKNVRAESSISQ